MATMSTADINAIKNHQSGFQSGQADAFVLGTELFANNPSYLGQYYARNGRKITTLSKMRSFFPGRLTTAASDSPIIGHWEGIDMRNTFGVKSITAGGQTDTATIVIADDDVYTERPDGAPADVTRTRPRIKDTIEAVAGGNRYVVTAKSADQKTITVRSFDGTAPAGEISIGMTLRVGAPITSEGTDDIAPLRKLRAKYTNRFWISPEKDVVTGSHLTSRGGYHMLADGRIYLEGIRDAEIRSEYNKSDVWLFGKQVENTAGIGMYSDPLKENTYLSGTQGLLDYALMLGEEVEVDPAGMTEEDFYAITQSYHDNFVGVDTVMGFFGSGLNQVVEEALASKINYTWVIGVSDQYVPADAKPYWGNDAGSIQGAFLSLGINGFEMNGIKFLKTAAPEFNDKYGAGAVGYKNWGILSPMGSLDDINGVAVPRLGYEYRGTQGYSRENELYVITGAGNSSILTGTQFNQLTKSSKWDAAEFFLRWEIAPHFAGGDQMTVLRPATGS